MTRTRLVVALLGMLPGAAMAEPATLTAIGTWLANSAWSYGIITTGQALAVAVAAYGSVAARKKARKAAVAARAAYNDSLADRSVTVLRNDPPWQVIYGRAIVGGAIVDIFATDKTGLRKENGSTYTKSDGLKHLVIAIAAHECEAIHEIYIDGSPVGTLDGNGQPTGGEFIEASIEATRVTLFTDSYVPPEPPISVISATSGWTGPGDDPQAVLESVTISGGTTLIGPAGIPVTVTYTVDARVAKVWISKHLGADSQTTSTYLASLNATRYTAAHRLRGICYAVVTLDMEEPRFQGGPPNITFDVSGRKVYDPRSTLTAYSENPALVIRDFLSAPWGLGVATAAINDASVITAANACDGLIDLVVDATTEPDQPLYTCNGAFSTDNAPEAVLEDLVECMAGSVTYGAEWSLLAGAWTPPVLDLDDDDLHGQIEVVQTDTSMSDLFNGVRGQAILRGAATPIDFNPYANAGYVAEDGRELWTNLHLPFTDHLARARNLSRIFIERNRSGQVIRYPAKLIAWPVQVGDRVTVTSTEYGLSAKVYRCTDWQFDTTSAVVLTLQEDAEDIYDLADAAVSGATPDTGLPNPWTVDPISGLAATSGNATLMRAGDGTMVVRVSVTWNGVTDSGVINGGKVQIGWRDNTGTDWTIIDVDPLLTQMYIVGPVDGQPIVIAARAVNNLGAVSSPVFIEHLVVGKSEAPSDVTGLGYELGENHARLFWDPCLDIDYAATELRVGAAWETADFGWAGKGTQFNFGRPADGTYTVWAAHIDTSGNYSAHPASLVVVIDDSIRSGVVTEYILACSDLTSDLEANAFSAYLRVPAQTALEEVRASLLTASSSGAVVVSITVAGADLFTTDLTIDQGEKTSTTAAIPAVIADSGIGEDVEVIVEIASAGVGARGLVVSLLGLTAQI